MACDSPTLIQNPYFRKDPSKGLNFLHDCTSQYIRVPCHKCGSCIALDQLYIVQRFIMESMVNHVFFATLTYKDEMLPVIEVNDRLIRYADMTHFTKMVKRIRKSGSFSRPFRYFVVSEFGGKFSRPHFHALFFLPKYPDDTFNTCISLEKRLYDVVFNEWRVNCSADWRRPLYRPLFEYHAGYFNGMFKRNFDLHYISPSYTCNGEADVAFYVMKYLLKEGSFEQRLQRALKLNLPESEYLFIWNIVKSKKHSSLYFGLGSETRCPHPDILAHLRKGISSTPKGSPYPYFINPYNGATSPLCPYYKENNHIFTFADYLELALASKEPLYNDSFDAQDALKNFTKYHNISKTLNNTNTKFYE